MNKIEIVALPSDERIRENDEKGIAPRALYKKFGFQEGEMTEEFGYPNQVFVLHP